MLVSDWLICSGATTRLLLDALAGQLATHAVHAAVEPRLRKSGAAYAQPHAHAALNAARHVQPGAQSQRPAKITAERPGR